MSTPRNMEDLLVRQRTAFLSTPFPTLADRRDRLKRAVLAILTHEAALNDALNGDFGIRSRVSGKTGDILGSVAALEYTIANLEDWMRPQPVALPEQAAAQGTRAELRYQPLGVMGALIPWNGPILMSCLAVAGAFGAGNRLMLKVPEQAPRASAALASAFGEFFDEDELVVVQGEADVAARFSRMPFDHLLYTGSTEVGRLVAQAAAANLTPVTLEMGGKSPAVLGHDALTAPLVERLVNGKLASAGQVCVAPDYILVPRGTAGSFIDAALAAAARLYPQMMTDPDYTAMINTRQFNRLNDLIADARAKGARLHGAVDEAAYDETAHDRRFPFTLLSEVSPDMRVMQEEIFGPILPVLEYDTLDNALAHIAANPHPLSAYYFGSAAADRQMFIDRVQTGSIVVNDVRCQLFYEALPFGGVGPSGMGRYRGRAGFERFSNAKTVLYQTDDDAPLAAQRPPFGSGVESHIDGMIRQAKDRYGID